MEWNPFNISQRDRINYVLLTRISKGYDGKLVPTEFIMLITVRSGNTNHFDRYSSLNGYYAFDKGPSEFRPATF